MNHSAQNAQQHTTHGAALKPLASVPIPTQRPRTKSLAERAEGAALMLASRLSADLSTIEAREAHGHYMRGFLTALEALGIVPLPRVQVLSNACNSLLDGYLILLDIKAMKASGNDNATDPVYLSAVSMMRRAGHADVDRLASDMGIGKAAARQLLDRMTADGIVNAPDLFGNRTLVVEVSHV